MSVPTIKSGKFHAGIDLQCGDNVVIDVAEEVVVGDRVVLADNTYLGGRRVEIGDDFYGYTWEWQRLDVGRGRRDCEYARFKVGNRVTLHNNRIDLAREVVLGNDVGLSPDVVIYTHHYWLSPLEGYPQAYQDVWVFDGAIVGFRSVLLPGARVGTRAVVGSQSVVRGDLPGEGVYAGNPARRVSDVISPTRHQAALRLSTILVEYDRDCAYRGLAVGMLYLRDDYPLVYISNVAFNVEALTVEGEEDKYTDDFRDFMFKRGIRFYTKRPFRRLGRQPT